MKSAVLVALLLTLYSIHADCVETLQFRRFGVLSLYRETPVPKHVILFLSGDGGWNKGTDERARALSTLDSLVVGIDTMYYLKHMTTDAQGCYNPAGDFDTLSRVLEKRLHFPSYVPTILLGYSLGATLVYGTLVQAEPHTFAGAISMGFCPEMPLDKPLCRGGGLEGKPYSTPKEKGYSLQPAQNLQDPWLVFQGEMDEVCSEAVTKAFVASVPHGEVVPLPKVGHGFRVESNWLPEFKQAFQRFETR